MVPKVRMSEAGPEVSQIVWGVWRLQEDPQGTSPEHLLRKIHACLECGITTFDHADIYGGYECEAIFGEALKAEPGLRDRMEIVTKCDINAPVEARPGVRLAHYDATAENIVRCVENSLRCLHTDHVDVLLIHRPDWLAAADDTAEGLNRMIREGKILHAGVSNYNVHQFDLLASRMDTPLVTNQIEFNVLCMDGINDGTLDQCQRAGIRPMGWSPMAGGRLFDPKDEQSKRVREAMTALADKYNGASADQLALAWMTAHPAHVVPVIGTNQIERIRAAAEATQIQLDRQDWYELWTASKGHSVP